MSLSSDRVLVIVPAWNEARNVGRTVHEAVSYTHLTLPTSDLV